MTSTNRVSLEKEFLTVAEIRRYLNISQSAAYELTHRKDFPVCRIGGVVRIPKEPFMAWVRARTYIPANLRNYAQV